MLPEKDRKMPVVQNFLDLQEPRLADNLKHNGETLMKFVNILGDFLQKSAAIYEQYGEELRSLVLQSRQVTEKLKNDGDFLIPSLLKTWDSMLNYTGATSEESIDIANKLSSDITIKLYNGTSHRKVQIQKLFEERMALESVVSQAEEQFFQAQKFYVESYSNHTLSGDKSTEAKTRRDYLQAHNCYVLQLHRYNSLIENFQTSVLPQWFQEIETVYCDVYSVLCSSVIDLNQRQGIKAVNESRRCEELIQMAKQVDPKADLILFARGSDPVSSPARGKRFGFVPPAQSAQDGPKDEIVVDNNTSKTARTTMENLLNEESNLEATLKKQYQQLSDLLTTQQKHWDLHLYNKVTAIQEDISDMRKGIRVTKLRLSGIHGQLCILDCRYSTRRSSVNYISPVELSEPALINNPGMKTKWKRAFFNLKRNGTLKREQERAPLEYVGGGSGSKLNLNCGQKSPKTRRNVFRADPSNSELNVTGLKLEKTALGNGSSMDIDPIYLLLKQGANLNPGSKQKESDSGVGSERRMSKASNDTGSSSSNNRNTIDRRNSSMSEPEPTPSATRVRPMLNARMKSISLDSSEHEVVQGRVSKPPMERGQSNVGSLLGTTSPGSRRRILQAVKNRVRSLDLGDGEDLPEEQKPKKEKAGTPQNLFVAMQSYRCKGSDELELRPGDRVCVIDSSQPDWWKGKCFSSTGYFPRECVARVNPGERVCVVTHSLQLNENGTVLRLSKDDIVMTTGADSAGMVPIRCGGKRASCPLKYLQVLGYFEE